MLKFQVISDNFKARRFSFFFFDRLKQRLSTLVSAPKPFSRQEQFSTSL